MKKCFLIIVIICSLFSCKKDKTTENQICFNATIVWRGSPAIDGLGWMIKNKTTNEEYKPQNLLTTFEQDGLNVYVCLTKTTEKYGCFCVQPLDYYKIEYISR